MTALRKQVLEEMQLRNFSESTKETYLSGIQTLAKKFNTCPTKITPEEIRSYLLFYANNRSNATFHKINAILRFLYTVVLKMKLDCFDIPFPKKKSKVPVVLSLNETKLFFQNAKSIKYRAMLMTIYSTGLRASEIVNLRVSDIDSERMLILVKHGKGGKERYVMLSPVLLNILREYWKLKKPGYEYLFPGRPQTKALNRKSVLQVCKKVANDAGLSKNVTLHTLRHSFATHLLEAGTDIRVLQALLGHRSIQTTALYTRVSQGTINAVKSPLDSVLED